LKEDVVMFVPRTESEIVQQINVSHETEGKCFGLSYEEGVRTALEWVLGDTDDLPVEE